MVPRKIVKVWYQNDWGQFARRDERLVREFVRDDRVETVVHLEPPVHRARLQGNSPGLADPLGWTRRRVSGVQQGKLTLFTPCYDQPTPARAWSQALAQVEAVLQERNAFGEGSVLWINAPSALGEWMIRKFESRFQWLLAEVEDDHRHYHVARGEEFLQTHRLYERTLRSSDLLISNSTVMLEEFRGWQPIAKHVPNAVNSDDFADAVVEPDWLRELPRPRITYVGNLALRLRPDILQAVIREFPQSTVILAGEPTEPLRRLLGTCRNVHFPGRVAPTEVPGLLCHSDVLLMPHQVGAFTDSMDPQKLYEFLASGRPVVATAVAGARDHADLLSLVDSPMEAVRAVRVALEEKDPSLAKRRRERVRGETWTRRKDQVFAALEGLPRVGERRHMEREMAYFEHDRPEIRALVPPSRREILDVGCGAGVLGESLQLTRDNVRVTGIELDPKAAARARERLFRVEVGDCVSALRLIPDASYDTILFADILEHLPDPGVALHEARRLLRRDGDLVISLPNVRHWSVLRDLLEGDWKYEDAGILDRTHLRFFTRRSATRLLQDSGFTVSAVQGSHWSDESMPDGFVAALRSVGLRVESLEEEAAEHQWLFRATPVLRAIESLPRRDEDRSGAEHGETKESVVAIPRVPAEPRNQSVAESVSVVIPVCNAADYTQQCLESVFSEDSVPGEVIVVDNGSADHTASVLQQFPSVQVLRNETNQGFSVAVNQGIRAAHRDLVCVLNNDTLVTEGWLEALVRPLVETVAGSSCPVAAVGPCTNYANGDQQIDLKNPGTREELFAAVKRWNHDHCGRQEDVSFLSGFCFAASHDTLRNRGFQEIYGQGTFEDTELSRALRKAGQRLLIVRDSYVHHFGNRTFQALGMDMLEKQRANAQLFASRHQQDLYFRAQAAFHAEQFDRAVSLAEEALRESPRDLDATLQMVLALERRGDQEEAQRARDRYRAWCPDDHRVPEGPETLSHSETRSQKAVPRQPKTALALLS